MDDGTCACRSRWRANMTNRQDKIAIALMPPRGADLAEQNKQQSADETRRLREIIDFAAEHADPDLARQIRDRAAHDMPKKTERSEAE